MHVPSRAPPLSSLKATVPRNGGGEGGDSTQASSSPPTPSPLPQSCQDSRLISLKSQEHAESTGKCNLEVRENYHPCGQLSTSRRWELVDKYCSPCLLIENAWNHSEHHSEIDLSYTLIFEEPFFDHNPKMVPRVYSFATCSTLSRSFEYF